MLGQAKKLLIQSSKVSHLTDHQTSADSRIEHFTMHITDVHCQHIIFGGSADNGYARLLGTYFANEEQSKRITMLQGPSFAKELVDYVDKFATTTFDTVFRKSKIPSRRVSISITPPLSPSPNYAGAVVQSLPLRPNPNGALSPNARQDISELTILRNSRGQRIDSPLRYSQNDLNDLRQRKLCNSYHLLGQCPYRNCTHLHEPKLSSRQREALRYIARFTPCTNGLECDDASCIAGHQCFRRGCVMVGCRFPREMHGVDTIPV